MGDTVSSLLWATPRDRQPLLRSLAGNLTKQSRYLAGESLTIADLALYSLVKQLGLEKDLQPELARWFKQVGQGQAPARQVKENEAKKEKAAGKGKSPSP